MAAAPPAAALCALSLSARGARPAGLLPARRAPRARHRVPAPLFGGHGHDEQARGRVGRIN